MAMTTLPVAIGLWSGYALGLSYMAIQDVRVYEERVEKAAKFSNIAEDALKQTRTTEAAGAVATLISLVTSIIIFSATFTGADPPLWVGIASSVVNAAIAYAARLHMHGYWRGKAKVPRLDKYNEAIDKTNDNNGSDLLEWLPLYWWLGEKERPQQLQASDSLLDTLQ